MAAHFLIDQGIEGDRRAHQCLIALYHPAVALQPQGWIAVHPTHPVAGEQFELPLAGQQAEHQVMESPAAVGGRGGIGRRCTAERASWPGW